MAQAKLTILDKKPGKTTLLVEFFRTRTYDAFMFKNNLFEWLFEHTMGDFELSSDVRSTFMVRVDETRDVNKLFKNFPNVSFDEVQHV